MNNTMTYEQIEKEFEELFVKKVMLIDEPDKLAYEEMKWQVEPELIKSFLKQSFIKYLQSDIERLEGYKMNVYPPEELLGVNYKIIYAEDRGYNNAISDQITHITNQIKELEV